MGLMQYLQETRTELNHVSWPTRTQTSIFTALVISLSILVSLYLGVFDYIFTNALSRALDFVPQTPNTIDLTEIGTSTIERTLPTTTPTLDIQ